MPVLRLSTTPQASSTQSVVGPCRWLIISAKNGAQYPAKGQPSINSSPLLSALNTYYVRSLCEGLHSGDTDTGQNASGFGIRQFRVRIPQPPLTIPWNFGKFLYLLRYISLFSEMCLIDVDGTCDIMMAQKLCSGWRCLVIITQVVAHRPCRGWGSPCHQDEKSKNHHTEHDRCPGEHRHELWRQDAFLPPAH